MSTDQNTISSRISGQQAAEAIHDGALLIDVRSATGRLRNGEIAGAVVVAKDDVLDILSKRIRRVSDEQKIVVFCGSVQGSGPVIEALVGAGFTNVHDVEGGFAALSAQGLKVIAPPSPQA